MALLNDELTVWEIGFRWAGLDPERRWLRIPLPVRDNFRNLIDAIWNAQLDCSAQWPKSKGEISALGEDDGNVSTG